MDGVFLWLVTLIIWNTHKIRVSGESYFHRSSNETIEAKVGENVTLIWANQDDVISCDVYFVHQTTMFQKINVAILRKHTLTFTNNTERVNYEHPSFSENGIAITCVNVSDAGNYVAHCPNNTKKFEARNEWIHLVVYDEPTKPNIWMTSNADHVILVCNFSLTSLPVTHQKHPVVTWYQDDVILKRNETMDQINLVVERFQDNHSYRCSAHERGIGIESQTSLMYVINVEEDTYLNINQITILCCVVVSTIVITATVIIIIITYRKKRKFNPKHLQKAVSVSTSTSATLNGGVTLRSMSTVCTPPGARGAKLEMDCSAAPNLDMAGAAYNIYESVIYEDMQDMGVLENTKHWRSNGSLNQPSVLDGMAQGSFRGIQREFS